MMIRLMIHSFIPIRPTMAPVAQLLWPPVNDAMKNGDKSRAQKLLKRWEASPS